MLPTCRVREGGRAKEATAKPREATCGSPLLISTVVIHFLSFVFYILYSCSTLYIFSNGYSVNPTDGMSAGGKGNRWNPIPVFSLKGYLSLSKQKR